MIHFFARVVELREGKIAFASESVKYDGKVTTDSPPREFLEVTNSQNYFLFSFPTTRPQQLTSEKSFSMIGAYDALREIRQSPPYFLK